MEDINVAMNVPELIMYDMVNINKYIELEEFIYYIDGSNNNKLYRISKQDGVRELVINCRVGNVVPGLDNVFYTMNYGDNITLNKCSFDGKFTQMISKNLSSIDAYWVEKDKIYFCEKINEKTYIKVADTNLLYIDTIYQPFGEVSELYYKNGFIYYKKNSLGFSSEQSLKRLSIGDIIKEDTVACFYRDICIYDEYAIYTDCNLDGAFIKNLVTGERVYKLEKCQNVLSVFNDYIFYTYDGFTDVEAKYVKDMLYCMNMKSHSISKLTDCTVCKVQMIGDYIYYKINEKDSCIYRQDIKTGQVEKIGSKRHRFKMFDKIFQ